MKYITRRLLRNRPNSEYLPGVSQRPHPEARYHRCADNAQDELERQHQAGRKVAIAAGWLVYPRDEDGNTTVCFHVWNYDPEMGQYYDVTADALDDGRVYDYVLDADVWLVPWDRAGDGSRLYFPPSLRYDDNGWIRIARDTRIDPETHMVEVEWMEGVQDQGQELPIEWLLDLVEHGKQREPERMAV